VPKKHTLKTLTNVLLKDGKAIATDFETMIIMDLPEVEEPYLLPYQALKDFLKYVPGNEQLTIKQTDGVVELSWEGGKATYKVDNPEDYPPLPEVKNGISGSVDGDRLLPALQSVIHYCGGGKSRAVLTGVSLTLNENIELAAGDGFRMAYLILPIPFTAQAKVIIPSHSARVIVDLWRKIPPAVPLADSIVSQVLSKRQLELDIGEGGMMARFGRVSVMVKTIDGNAPNFKALIPKEPPTKIRAFAPDFERAVHRCASVASNVEGLTRFEWKNETLTVSAK
ncbi:unnamed protein product, partial [marine sediment metagenome]